MWESSFKRRLRTQNQKKAKKAAVPVRLKKLVAQLREITAAGPLGSARQAVEPIEIHVALREFTETGLEAFAPNGYSIGQTISLSLETDYPVRRIYLKGRIVWSDKYLNDQKIIYQRPMPYRIGVRFTFETDEEREAVRTFVADLLKSEDWIKEAA